jgi:hypothetical protein
MRKSIKLDEKDISNIVSKVLSEQSEENNPSHIVRFSDLQGRKDWNIRDIVQRKKGKIPYKKEKNGILKPVDQYSQSESNDIFYVTKEEANQINSAAQRAYEAHKEYKRLLSDLSDVKFKPEHFRFEILHELDKDVTKIKSHLLKDEVYDTIKKLSSEELFQFHIEQYTPNQIIQILIDKIKPGLRRK